MKDLKLSWPLVALIFGIASLVLIILAWLVQTGKAHASVLLAPLSSLVVGASAYVVGLMRTPPWMDPSGKFDLPSHGPTPLIPTPPPPAWGDEKEVSHEKP